MRTAILLISVLAASFAAQPIRAHSLPEQGNASKVQFTMGPRYAHMPEKFFMLVRKGREIGAIRLIKITENTDGIGKTIYQSYFQGDGSGSFMTPNVVKRSGEIDIKPMRGVHAFAWQPGQSKLWVGKWWFGCYSPSLVNMSLHFSEKDEGYEFAPTSARELADVDASDKRLKWFRYDTDASISFLVSDLPK